jgi:hypothetical protein
VTGRRALTVALALVALTARAAGDVPPRVAPLLDDRADRVVQQTVVPSPEQQVGRVRLVRRGDVEVVQTLLATKLLKRVTGEIRAKEAPNWPPDAPGRDDSLRYLDALDAAQRTVWSRVPKDDPASDRVQRLWIEFALAKDAAVVAIGTFAGTDDAVRVRERETLAVLEPSRDYVARNMRLIAADSFHADGAALDALLAELPLARRAAR